MDHFDSSYQGYQLAFWQQGQGSWNHYSKEERQMYSTNLCCPDTVSLGSSCKEVCGLWALHCMVNGLPLYNAFILRVLQSHLSYCLAHFHITSQFTHSAVYLSRVFDIRPISSTIVPVRY